MPPAFVSNLAGGPKGGPGASRGEMFRKDGGKSERSAGKGGSSGGKGPKKAGGSGGSGSGNSGADNALTGLRNLMSADGENGFIPPGLRGKSLPPGNPFSGRTGAEEENNNNNNGVLDIGNILNMAANTPELGQLGNLPQIPQTGNVLNSSLFQTLNQGIPGATGIPGVTAGAGQLQPNLLGTGGLAAPGTPQLSGVFQPFSQQTSPLLAQGPPGILEGVSSFFLQGDAAGGIAQLFNNVQANSQNRLNQLTRLLQFAPIV